MSALRERKILVIGDSSFCLIGAAAGTDYFVFRGDCSELSKAVSDDYGIYIVLRDVYSNCRSIVDELMRRDVLVIVVDSPKIMKEVDPKKHYEELIAKYIGIRINL